MVRPVDNETDLNRLDKLNFSDLRHQFQVKAALLKHKIFKECQPKLMNGKPLDGKFLAKIIEMYIQSINSGAVMNVTSVWQHVVNQEREKQFEKAKTLLDKEFKAFEKDMPYNEDQFIEYSWVIRGRALNLLNKQQKMVQS
jgi:hypothetical protein